MLAAPHRPVRRAAAAPVPALLLASVVASVATGGEGEFVPGPYIEVLADCYGAAADLAGRRGCIGEASSICIDEEPRGATARGRVACLGIEADAWDIVLQGELRLTADWARRADAAGPPASPDHPRRAEALRAAQAAWEDYANAECRFAFARSGPVGAAACRLETIAGRAVALNAARAR